MARNTELFIDLVQKYPVLYDVSHQDYKNRRVKNKIWDEICQMLDESDGDTLKKQWKNLRDAYSKHLRSKMCSGQASKHIDRYKTWPWASLMSFLRPHLEYAETQPDNEEAGTSWTGHSNDTNFEEVQTTTTPPNNTRPYVRRRKRLHDQTQSQSQINKVIHFIGQKDKEDDTDLLFKSYAKKLKKMDLHRQATVKFEIAKIMMQAELEESDEIRARSDTEKKMVEVIW